jgi:hypothetical protein
VQQLSLDAPQFVVPAPLTSQLGGIAVHAPALQYGVATGHATAVPQPVHPLDCIAHVSTPPVAHCSAPFVHAFVQHAPALHAPLGHVVDADSNTHPCGSFAHVANVDVVRHTSPTAVHVESALHVHEADPEGPVQLWCAPGHACTAPHWPFDPHVSTLVPEHRVPVGVHSVELLDAELLLVELLELVDIPVLLLVEAASLDAELPVIALLELVDVLVPLAPEPPAALLVLELPFEPPTLELEPVAGPRPPPSARVPSPMPRIESQPARLRPRSAVRRRVARQRPNGRITTSPARSGRPYSHSCSARRSPAHAGRSPTS